MKSIHVRNIFQLVIPLQAPPNSLSVVSHLLTSGDEFGFAVVDMLSKGKFEYKVHILNAFYGTKKGDAVVQNCLAWAKRNPISFQNDKDSGDIVGIILRLKVQQGFFDFRRIAKQNIQLKVDCLSDMAQSFCKIASSEIIQLLPKKRKGKYDIEVVIPLVWRDENYEVAQDLSSIEYSLENSPEIVYHSTEAAYSSSPEQQSYINFNPTAVYEESNQLELSVVNEGPAEMYNVPVHNGSNSNEQYMVLYNGNAEVIGNFRALNFYKASDINIKEDIRLISEFADARDVLMKIDGVDYKFKKGVNAAVNRRFVGYIAQQVESVVPDAVQLIDGILHVDYESLIPYLSESIRANLNDIKENQAKTERIEKIVDMLYQQFLKQSKGDTTNTKAAPSTSKITPKQRSKKFSWKIITAAVVSTALVAIIATVLFFTLSTDGTASPRPVTPSPVDIDERRRILEELFIATNGTNWKNKTGWMTNTSICSWHGVCGCDTMFWLCLQDNNLQGFLPESLGYLPLHRVSMSGNKLEGSLPSSFYQQDGMTTLDLSNNMLTHVNVKALFKLPNLVDLNLSNNRITGVLEISSDSLMTRLDLSYNQFIGTVPNLESLESLQRLDLSHNSFQGSVPSLPLRGLSYLSLESNRFEGEIWRLNHFTKLEELNLANNNFEGEVPFDEDQLGRMSYLNMSHNKFSSVRASNITLIHDDFICDATNVSFECPIPDWLAIRCAAKCS